MAEEGLHADTEGFVVAVDVVPVGGFASHSGAAHAGEDRADDLVAEGEQRCDGAGGLVRHVVVAGAVRTCPQPTGSLMSGNHRSHWAISPAT